MCTGGCPVARKANLNVRRYMREVALGNKLILHPPNELWSCTTCATCGIRCPKEITPYDFLIDIRSIAVEKGQIAATLRDALESIFKNGNPWGRIRAKRSEWAQDFNVKHASQDIEVLYFVGCTPAYDPRVQEVAKSLVKCFEKGEVNFGTLGNEENCCGSEVYCVGEKGLFEFLIGENMRIFKEVGVKHMVTTSPHCYNVFKNRYGEIDFEVEHYTQFIADLIDNGKLVFSRQLNKKVTYHDPCYLGKQNGVYEAPRMILESIPGVSFVELDRSKEKSLCCEGGGGRMWIDIPGERLAETRVQEAVENGAEILATACPFCLLTLEDAVKTLGVEDRIQVRDIAELLCIAL